MDFKRISDQYAVSEQISPADLDEIAAQGVKLLICNRPDNESGGQPSFDEIRAAAEAHGIEAVNIPFAGGQLTIQHVEEFKAQIDRGLKTHAYCRTGNRCTIIWDESQKL